MCTAGSTARSGGNMVLWAGLFPWPNLILSLALRCVHSGGEAGETVGLWAGLFLIALVPSWPLQLSDTPKGERYSQLLSALTSHKDR